MRTREHYLRTDFSQGFQKDGRGRLLSGVSMINDILGFGFTDCHAVIGGICCRVWIFDLGNNFQSFFFCLGQPFGQTIASVTGGAVYKSNPGLALPAVIFCDPFDEDFYLITVGRP